MTEKITYKDAGVDVELADSVIASLGKRIQSTHRSGVLGKLGGFAGMVRVDRERYAQPILVAATDGVGTKLKLAFLTGVHDTIGIDLVAMNANDVLVSGAAPMFFLDYFSTGSLEPKTIESVITGIVRGCEMADCSLIGGETAEMPDFYDPGEYDLAGFCVGIVDEANIISGSEIEPGDIVLGLPSSGLHSNGYSLVRKVLLERSGYSLDAQPGDLSRSLGEELLAPTAIYVRPVLRMLPTVKIHGMVHITGGGFPGNIPRVLPESCGVVIRRNRWERPAIFNILQKEAGLDDSEMFETFNMGIGMVLIVPEVEVDQARQSLLTTGLKSYVIGEVTVRKEKDAPVVFE